MQVAKKNPRKNVNLKSKVNRMQEIFVYTFQHGPLQICLLRLSPKIVNVPILHAQISMSHLFLGKSPGLITHPLQKPQGVCFLSLKGSRGG